MTARSTDPLAVIESLGPLHVYRSPAAAAAAATRIVDAQRALERSFVELATDRDRARYALEVASTLLLTLRKRAGCCELAHADLACENVDTHQVLADWIEFAKARL